MQFPSDVNGDVFRRMQKSGFDFSKPHDVDFFAIFPTKAAADLVAKQYVADHKAGNLFVNIESKPASEGGMELLLVKNMLLTHQAITAFEREFEARASAHGGYLDGWGVMQEAKSSD